MKPLEGTLVTPDDNPIADATVRFIATSNTTDGALKGTMFEFTTDTDVTVGMTQEDIDLMTPGRYAVEVLPGSYKVEFKNLGKAKYITLGHVTLPAYAEDVADSRTVTDTFTINASLTTEVTTPGTTTIIASEMVNGTEYTIVSIGNTAFDGVGCTSCTGVAAADVGRVFIYTSGAIGTGTVSYVTYTTEEVVTTTAHTVAVDITGGTPDYAVSSRTGTLSVPAVATPIISLIFDNTSIKGTYGTLTLDTGNSTPDGKWTYAEYVNSALPLEDIGIS